MHADEHVFYICTEQSAVYVHQGSPDLHIRGRLPEMDRSH